MKILLLPKPKIPQNSNGFYVAKESQKLRNEDGSYSVEKQIKVQNPPPLKPKTVVQKMKLRI